MSVIDDLYPPAQYAWGWLIAAFAVIILFVAITWVVTSMTRQEFVLDDDGIPDVPLTSAEVVARLQREYAAGIDGVEANYRAGKLSPREANLALSAIVRQYVNEYSGLEAPVLTLDDLEQLDVHPALIDAMRRHYYPGIFRSGRSIDPIAGAHAARQVVAKWH